MRPGLILSLALLVVQPVSAQTKGEYYFGLSAGSASYEEPGVDFKVTTLGGKLGYRYSEYLGVEIQGVLGGSDDQTGVVSKISFDLNWVTGAYLRAGWSPVDDGRIQLYGLFGFSQAEFGNSAATFTETGLSYAFGMELYANRKHGIYFQVGQYLDDDLGGVDYSMDHLGLGYMRLF